MGICQINQPGVLANPVLSSAQATVVGTTTATTTVTSDSTEGVLYAAARTSGPYTAGDEQAIKDGTGADWSGNKASPVAGVNTFNLTGLTDGQQYYCGFVQEVDDPIVGYEHSFNADLGGFTFSRTGYQIGWTDTQYDQYTDDGQPAYDGTDHSGVNWPPSPFIPHANFRGLRLGPAETATLVPTDDLVDWYSYNGIDVGTVQVPGIVEFTRCQYTTSSPGSDSVAKSTLIAGQGPWTWTCYVMEGTAPGFTMEVSGSRGRAHFAWSGGNLTLDGVEDGAEQMCYPLGNGVWAAGLRIPTTTHEWKDAHFYPAKKGSAFSSGDYTWFQPGMFQDGDKYAKDCGDQTVAESFTVAAQSITSTVTNLGLNDLGDEFSGHVQFYAYSVNVPKVATHWFFEIAGNTNNRIRFGFLYDHLRVHYVIDGVGAWYFHSSVSFKTGDLVDMRFVVRAQSGVSLWYSANTGATGSKYVDTQVTGSFAVPLTSVDFGASVDASCPPIILKHFKLFDQALSDAQVEALTV